MELNEAKEYLNKKGYELVESFELTDETIEAAKEKLEEDGYYPYDAITAAFEKQDAWQPYLEGDTPDDVANAVSDFLDNLSDEELEEIGAI